VKRAARALLAAVGVAALVAALTLDAGSVLPVDAALSLLGNDYYLVAAVGGVALALALAAFVSGRASNIDQTDLPAPERPTTAPAAGSEFDSQRRRWRLAVPVYGADGRRRLRARLRTAAVETVQRADACDRSTAEDRVDRGEWTDDAVAAAYLATDRRVPASVRLRSLLTGAPPAGYPARRTAEAVVDREAGE
jgi:hypothetical protein